MWEVFSFKERFSDYILGLAEQHCTLSVNNKHVQLFLLFCTTTWHQPYLRKDIVHKQID